MKIMIDHSYRSVPSGRWERRVWLEVIARAVFDWNSKRLHDEFEEELQCFFYSEGFENICRAAEVKPEDVRKQCKGLKPRSISKMEMIRKCEK